MLKFDEGIHDAMLKSREFFDAVRSKKSTLNQARERGSEELSGSLKKLIDNLNSLSVILSPSKIHRVGVFVGPGGADIIGRHVDPFRLTAGVKHRKTIDLTTEELQASITDPLALVFIENHIDPYEGKDGKEYYPLPSGGPNALDISYFVNTTFGTKHTHNIETIEDIDERGVGRMVMLKRLKEGEELLADYSLVDENDNGENNNNNNNSVGNKNANNHATNDLDEDIDGDDVDYTDDTSQGDDGDDVEYPVKKKQKQSKKGTVANRQGNQQLMKAYSNALDSHPKVLQTKPHSNDKVKLEQPTTSSIVDPGDLPKKWRKKVQRSNQWKTYWENKGKPPYEDFPGENVTAQRMNQFIYCAEYCIGCDTPNVRRFQYVIACTKTKTVKCMDCMQTVSIKANAGRREDLLTSYMETHSIACKELHEKLRNGKCNCGRTLSEIQEEENYANGLRSLGEHVRVCKNHMAMIEELIAYKDANPQQYDEEEGKFKVHWKYSQLYNFVKDTSRSQNKFMMRKIEEIGF